MQTFEQCKTIFNIEIASSDYNSVIRIQFCLLSILSNNHGRTETSQANKIRDFVRSLDASPS